MTALALAAPYRRLFALPGTRAFTTGNLLARLPMGMFGVSAVVMIAAAYGSYALAGAVTATGLATTAAVAPWTARLTDRLGQARVAVPAAGLAALGSLALVVCVRLHAPVWTLFAAYAATATTPNTGGMARARWAHLYRDDERARHVANSFEQAADEVCFMLGPVLAAFLCTALFPEAGTLAGALLLFGGILLFAAQRGTEPPPVRRPRTGSGSGSAAGTGAGRAAVPAVLLTFLATGAVFGALEVTTIAFADSQGHRGAAGAVLALQAAGSCAAGLLYGLRRPRGTDGGRFAASVALMAVLMLGPLPAAALGGLWLLAPALLPHGHGHRAHDDQRDGPDPAPGPAGPPQRGDDARRHGPAGRHRRWLFRGGVRRGALGRGVRVRDTGGRGGHRRAGRGALPARGPAPGLT